MNDRQQIAILTAVLRAQDPTLDGDTAVMAALGMVRGGMGERELIEAVATICPSTQEPQQRISTAMEILRDVDFALALRRTKQC
jgi:hypothetical protein